MFETLLYIKCLKIQWNVRKSKTFCLHTNRKIIELEALAAGKEVWQQATPIPNEFHTLTEYAAASKLDLNHSTPDDSTDHQARRCKHTAAEEKGQHSTHDNESPHASSIELHWLYWRLVRPCTNFVRVLPYSFSIPCRRSSCWGLTNPSSRALCQCGESGPRCQLSASSQYIDPSLEWAVFYWTKFA